MWIDGEELRDQVVDQQDLSLTQSRSLEYGPRSLLGEVREGRVGSMEEKEEEWRMLLVSLEF